MPLYEYVCEQDDSVIELLRPASQADDPVADPLGKGRRFRRRLSTFAHGSAPGHAPAAGAAPGQRGGCACGKGGCGAG